MDRIIDLEVRDIRFPTSLEKDGSDAMNVDPDYSAAYFQGGQTLERLGQTAEAREFYLQGIEAATRKGDFHTRSEIQAALDLIG